MRRRTILVGLLGIGALANVALVADMLLGGLLFPAATASSGGAAPAQAAAAVPSISIPAGSRKEKPQVTPEAAMHEAEEAYRGLVSELQQQKQTLEQRALELTERERQLGVLRQEIEVQKQQAAESLTLAREAQKSKQLQQSENFKKMVKAYSGMEPENGAKALVELYGRDRDVAVDLMLALSARRASAILDALAADKAAIAADIALEMTTRTEPRAE